MIRNELLQILTSTWPTLAICIIILTTLRVMQIIKTKEKIVIYNELINLFFIIYVLCLFHTVTGQDNMLSGSNFIPFKEIFRYTFLSNLFIKNIFGNIIMFIPYGFFVGYYLKSTTKLPAVIMGFIVSSSIEVIQLMIGRIIDIDDIILNTVGSFIGIALYTSINNIKNIMPTFLKKDWFYNIIVLLIFIIFLAFLTGFIELGV